MVIVKLIGGLGNQMFQYAAGRALALHHRTPLKLDISGFAEYRLRTYRLHHFRIQAELATPREVAHVTGMDRTGLWKRVFWRIQHWMPYYRRCTFQEDTLRPYDPNIWRTPRDVYLDGYWQSEKYFADVADIIRREFQLKEEPSASSRAVANRMHDCQAISLHVRRGDYVSNPRTHRVHGVCSLEYYRRCIAFIVERVERPTFFVFSDDMAWTREHVPIEGLVEYVTHNGAERDYEDLWLMSQCRHHILANSSFSWWGAWLNPNPDKLVLAPQRWFNDSTLNTRDLLPEGWIAL
ncbi:MAG: alpha-1,2-fucosyltransferase [Anaerolineae bacterium]